MHAQIKSLLCNISLSVDLVNFHLIPNHVYKNKLYWRIQFVALIKNDTQWRIKDIGWVDCFKNHTEIFIFYFCKKCTLCQFSCFSSFFSLFLFSSFIKICYFSQPFKLWMVSASIMFYTFVPVSLTLIKTLVGDDSLWVSLTIIEFWGYSGSR